MKYFYILSLALVSTFSATQARDLTYRLGVGYSQATYYYVADKTPTENIAQAQGLDVSYGFTKDLMVGTFFGFQNNFDVTLVGGYVRYDYSNLINRDSLTWTHLNLYVKAATFAKIGSEQAKGISIHLPSLGFEILPFERNNFAVGTEFGLIFDLKKRNKINLPQAQFGDISVKYYF